MKKNKFKMAKIFTLVFTVVTVCLMITLADLFSSLITVGGFTFTSDDLNISSYNLYAVSTSFHSAKILADEQAETNKKQGGAGYVFINESAYNIIASIYESKTDAEKVKENLKITKPDTTIIEIAIPNIVINSNLNSQEKSVISESINIFKTAYKKLYDISVSLDTSIINEINAKLNINEVNSEANTVMNNFNTMFSNSNLSNLVAIKLRLQDLCNSLDELINSSANYPYTSYIKYSYCKIVFLYKDLAKSLS